MCWNQERSKIEGLDLVVHHRDRILLCCMLIVWMYGYYSDARRCDVCQAIRANLEDDPHTVSLEHRAVVRVPVIHTYTDELDG